MAGLFKLEKINNSRLLVTAVIAVGGLLWVEMLTISSGAYASGLSFKGLTGKWKGPCQGPPTDHTEQVPGFASERSYFEFQDSDLLVETDVFYADKHCRRLEKSNRITYRCLTSAEKPDQCQIVRVEEQGRAGKWGDLPITHSDGSPIAAFPTAVSVKTGKKGELLFSSTDDNGDWSTLQLTQ